MFIKIVRSLIFGCFLCLSLISPSLLCAGDEPTIKFGALPVLQALPLFVAMENSLFVKKGVKVEIVPFSNASEKDIAMSSGAIDGYFGDLLTPLVLKGNGKEVVIVAGNYDTRLDRRMFAILAKPGNNLSSLTQLADVPVALSSNSVIDYVTEYLLKAAGLPEEKIAKLESKNIGIRMQMLMSGQVEAATLPEPLVTAALAKGASLLADDSGLAFSQTVLVFQKSFVEKNRNLVKAFLDTVTDANEIVNSKADMVREIMVKHVLLPQALRTVYPVPHFPKLFVPDRATVQTVAEWLKSRKVIREDISYSQVVDGSFLQ
jgi:NitT/TauT family transport system substrate-binding protein